MTDYCDCLLASYKKNTQKKWRNRWSVSKILRMDLTHPFGQELDESFSNFSFPTRLTTYFDTLGANEFVHPPPPQTLNTKTLISPCEVVNHKKKHSMHVRKINQLASVNTSIPLPNHLGSKNTFDGWPLQRDLESVSPPTMR